MMKFTLRFAASMSLLVALVAPASADEVPKKSPVGRYVKLWTSSPFTEKPPPPEKGEVISPLDDFTLAGVSPIEGGYSVILINKKKREERVHLLPGMGNEHGFKVISVRQDPISNKNTTVEIQTADGKSDRVGYEQKYLALKAAPVARPAAGQKPAAKPAAPGQIPGLTPGAKTPTPAKGSAPRVRRVPTPTQK